MWLSVSEEKSIIEKLATLVQGSNISLFVLALKVLIYLAKN